MGGGGGEEKNTCVPLAAWWGQAAALDSTSAAQLGLPWVLLHLLHRANLHKRAEHGEVICWFVHSFIQPLIHSCTLMLVRLE